MELIVKDNYEEMTEAALRLFMTYFDESKVIGFATGSTPTLLYGRMSDLCKSKQLSFKDKISFNLDEYCSIEAADRRSYRYYMEKNLFSGIDINRNNIHFPDSELPGKEAVEKYKNEIKEFGPVDFQILGIGRNGHLAFNEPGSKQNSVTRVVRLERDTIQRNKAPSETAITMGITEILESGVLMIMASGSDKANALYKALKEKPTPSVPASFVQLHKKVFVIADKDAAELLL